jgi:hypothetical protein
MKLRQWRYLNSFPVLKPADFFATRAASVGPGSQQSDITSLIISDFIFDIDSREILLSIVKAT